MTKNLKFNKALFLYRYTSLMVLNNVQKLEVGIFFFFQSVSVNYLTIFT